MQAQFMAMIALAEGASLLSETIFENRYMHVPELARMGADITVTGSSALVRGVHHLIGARVIARDLLSSMSLLIARLAPSGAPVRTVRRWVGTGCVSRCRFRWWVDD